MTDVMPRPTAAEHHFTWDWTSEEHRRVHRLLLRHSRTMRLVTFVVAMVLLATMLSLAAARDAVGAFSGALPWLLWTFLWVGILVWWSPRASARGHTRLHHGPQWIEIGHGAVASGCDACSMKLDWSRIIKAVESRDHLLLFYTPNCAVWMPKRVISAGELGRVRAVIRDKLGKHAKLLAA